MRLYTSTGPSFFVVLSAHIWSTPEFDVSASRIQALSSRTFVDPDENASMPMASVSVGNTRIDVAHLSLTNISRIE